MELSTEITSPKVKGRVKEKILRSYKNLLKKNKNMVINVSAEGIATIRQAILHCANELMAAVNCEDRFNDVLISDTMGALANAISRVDD